MGKRTADEELTDRNVHQFLRNREEDEGSERTEFKHASQQELAKRVIKTAKRSALPSSAAAPPTFAGFSSSSTSFASTPFASTPAAPTFSFGAAAPAVADDSEAKHLKQLRGLNVSLLNNIKKFVEEDPVADLTSLLSQYSDYREKIDKEFGGAKSSAQAKPASASSSTIQSPPAVFSFGGPAKKAEEQPKKPEEAKSIFSFGKPAPDQPKKTEEASKPVFSFGKPAEDAKKPEEKKAEEPSKPLFSFGKPAAEEPKKAEEPSKPVFSFGKPAEETKKAEEPSKPVFSFGKPAEEPKKTEEVKPVFSFGKPAEEAKKPEEKKAEEPSKPLFSFGKPAETGSTPAPSFGGFGSATGSTFGGFGSATSSSGFGGFGSTSAPSFGAGPSKVGGGGGGGDDDDGEGSGEASVLDDDGGVRTNADLIKKGEGEEGEDTLFELEKAKLFLLKEGAWTDTGVGLVKINKNQESGKKRVLSRAEGSGRVLLNAALFPLMGVQRPEGKKDVQITTVTAEKKTEKYLLRCKSLDDATKLQQALDKYKAD